MTRWYFDLSPCPSSSLSLSLSLVRLCVDRDMSFCRTQISLVETVTQWDKCHRSFFLSSLHTHPSTNERKAHGVPASSYRRFISLYHTTNHCLVSSAHEIIIVVCCCSISLSLIDLWSTTGNANNVEREREREREKKTKEKKVFCCCCTSSARD